jgi:hypothetical protein
MRQKTLGYVVGSVVAVMAMLFATAGSAMAAGQGTNPKIDCNTSVDIGYTVWYTPGTTIAGSGSWTRCDNTFSKIDIGLWRQIVGNIYTRVDRKVFDPADFGYHSEGVAGNCRGYNARWYTTIVATDINGKTIINKTSNTILANCA